MSYFKRFIISALVFNLVYGPTASFADNGGGDSGGDTTDYSHEVETQKISAQEQEEIKKGSRVDVVVEDGNSRVKITPGSDLQAVYESGRPSAIRSKMGSIAHYFALRTSDPAFHPNAPAEMQRDKKDPITFKDVKHGAVHFFNETLSFQIALIGLKVVDLVKHYGSNPVVLEELWDSAKDPFGHISFYAFMVANGYTADFLNDKFLNSSTSGVAMKKWFGSVVPYLSMTAGSMTSHIVGDTLHLMKACAKNLGMRGRGEIKEGIPEQITNDPCEMAWKDWTIEKKFHVYGPSLISMLTATWAAGKTTSILASAKNKLKTVAMKNSEESAAARAFLKFSLQGTRFGVIAANSRSLRYTFMIAGKTPNFILFLGLTELFEPYITKQFENVTRTHVRLLPGLNTFGSLADDFMKVVLEEKKNGWNKASVKAGCEGTSNIFVAALSAFFTPSLLIPFIGKKCKTDDVIDWLVEFSEFMEGWREFNQSEPMASHSAWIRKTGNLKNAERLAFYYNNKMLEDLQDYKTAKRVNSEIEKESLNKKSAKKLTEKEKMHQDLVNGAKARQARYQSSVMRLYPLYGVKSAKYSENQKELYFKNPEALEEDQLATLKEVTYKFLMKRLEKMPQTKNDKEFFEELITTIKTSDKYKIGLQLKKIHDMLFEYKIGQMMLGSGLSEPTMSLLKEYSKELGNPTPSLAYGLGYANAFMDGAGTIIVDAKAKLSAANYLEEAKLDDTFGAYRNVRKVDHLTYQMVCGADLFYGNKDVVSERFGFSDEFIPPRIVKSNVDADICDFSPRLKSSEEMYFDKIKDKYSNKTYEGIFNFIIPNLRTDIQEIVSVERKEDQLNFAGWWNDTVEPVIRRQFEKYRKQYEEIAVKFVESLYAKDATLNKGSIKSSVAYSTMQEIRIYSLLMGEIVSDKIRTGHIDPKFPLFNLMAGKDLTSWKPVQAKSHEDVFKFQLLSYNSDLFFLNNINNVKTAAVPRVYEFQYQVEHLIRHYHNILSKIQIEKAYGKDQTVIKYSDSEMEAFNKQKQYIEEVFKSLVEQFSAKAQSVDDQRVVEILKFCTGKIMALAGQIDGFVALIKAVDYNRNGGPTKVKCRDVQLGRKSLQVGQCD